MKIILIYLPKPYLRQPEAQAPLGLLYLAAILEKVRIDVKVKNYSLFTDDEAMANLPEANFYGITATSMELLQANRFSKRIKEKYPESKVAIGGPGAVSSEFIDWDFVDTACVGEGENAILEMMASMEDGGLKKQYIGKPVKDIDKIPYPSRHLLGDNQGGNIFAYNRNYMGKGSVTILTSRGCPFKCAFCSVPHFNGGIRFRDPKFVADEIIRVMKEFGIRQFRISDDMFTVSKEHVFGICDYIGDLNIAWRISIRAKPLSMDILKTLYQAGCREVSIGIESFDDDVLKCLNKGTTAANNAKALEMCKKAGLKTRMLFMIRTPGQTKYTIKKNLRWLNEVPYDIIACTTFVPLPGSDIWENPDKYNIEILNRNLDDYNFYFFNADGENKIKSIIKIKDRSLEEFNRESLYFKNYLKETGKLNTG